MLLKQSRICLWKKQDNRENLIQNSLETILHYLILYSIINNGIKSKDYDSIRREILLVLDISIILIQMFGFQYLPLLTSLEKAKLLIRRDNSNNYSVLKGKLRLIRNDVDGTQPIDIKYPRDYCMMMQLCDFWICPDFSKNDSRWIIQYITIE